MLRYISLTMKHSLLCYTITAGLILYLALAPAYAQKALHKDSEIEQHIEMLFQAQAEQDIDWTDFFENLYQLYQAPLNLNTAGRHDLQALCILSELQINAFLLHRQHHGSLLAIQELQAIEGFDLLTIERILPFISIDPLLKQHTLPLKERLRKEAKQHLLIRHDRTLETRKGYTPPALQKNGTYTSRYAGSPDRIMTRYRLTNSNDISLGFTAEKDAGEQITWQPNRRQYGMDFYSAHLMLQNRGRLKTIIVGDYQLQTGQGLVLSSGLRIGKGGETITTVRKVFNGLRPHTSAMESGFMRGAAATFQLHNLQLTTFASRNRLDANLNTGLHPQDSLEQEELYFTSASSINLSGLHRTPTELANRKSLLTHTGGANLHYQPAGSQLHIGANLVATHYQYAIERAPALHNQFAFRGQHNVAGSMYGSYTWQNVNFFGEAARTLSGGMGAVAGFVSSLSARVELSMLARHYERHFHSLHGAGFGETNRTQNESGIYWGLKLKPHRHWTFSTYYDRYHFPWLTFNTAAPSRGQEALFRLQYQPSRTIIIYGQGRIEARERNRIHNPYPVQQLAIQTRYNYLLHLDYQASKALAIRSRVQMGQFRQDGSALAEEYNSKGYVIFQEVSMAVSQKLSFSARTTLFDVDDFYSRQYVYEKDVLYYFAIPSFQGKGIRNYVVAHYRINHTTELWCKIARTGYRDRDTVASGLEEIDGPARTDVRWQVRRKF
jgi:hypothetical protein